MWEINAAESGGRDGFPFEREGASGGSEGSSNIDVIEIVFAIEEKFGVTLPFNANESAVAEFETIGKVADAVKAVVGEKAAS